VIAFVAIAVVNALMLSVSDRPVSTGRSG
jgi:hypothetical protein